MQPVQIDEPTVEETIDILKGIRKYYERFHKIEISDEVIEEAVKLSDRYLVDRFLPDKAIDVIDEASSKLKVNSFKLPQELLRLREEYKSLKDQKEEAVNNKSLSSKAQTQILLFPSFEQQPGQRLKTCVCMCFQILKILLVSKNFYLLFVLQPQSGPRRDGYSRAAQLPVYNINRSKRVFQGPNISTDCSKYTHVSIHRTRRHLASSSH